MRAQKGVWGNTLVGFISSIFFLSTLQTISIAVLHKLQ
jgi:hypothetical protein